MVDAVRQEPFKWVGGALCLDFNNTVDWKGLVPDEGDRLSDLSRLASWGRAAGLLSSRQHQRLAGLQQANPGAAPRILDRALTARLQIHRAFFRVALGEPPDGDALGHLNRFLARVPPRVVCNGSTGCRWSWPETPEPEIPLLWPVLWSASHLLTSPDRDRVKTCANQHCGWLFLDQSRRHNRRWCEMGVCGNRAKARRFHARHRG
ncbi:MAG TPA: ABATE domain-containing protein [Gemmatimonadales bacterium]|nr:ABATE domain-containing protein [Gemmatimonadales bacterium]